MKNKPLLIFGICLWIGGAILGNLFRFITETSRFSGASVIFFLLASILMFGAAMVGFVMTIVAIVRMIRDRNLKVARNIRVARKVR